MEMRFRHVCLAGHHHHCHHHHQVYEGQLEKRLTQLVGSGLVITVNSDDAAYFGGYAVANYNYLAQVTGMGVAQVGLE